MPKSNLLLVFLESLDDYWQSTRQNRERLQSVIRRIEAELTFSNCKSPANPCSKKTTSQRIYAIYGFLSKIAQFLRSLPSAFRQDKSLTRLLASHLENGQPVTATLIALSSRRSALNPKIRLDPQIANLLTPLSGSLDHGSTLPIIGCDDTLIIFDCLLTSPLVRASINARFVVVDYTVLIISALKKPFKLAKAILRESPLALARSKRRSAHLRDFAALFWLSILSGAFASQAPIEAVFTTSNSRMLEMLRLVLLMRSSRTSVYEILHGTPSLESFEYINKLGGRYPAAKHHLVSSLPNTRTILRACYAPTIELNMELSINLTLNRYYINNSKVFLGAETHREICRFIPNLTDQSAEQPILTVFMGGNSHDSEFFSSTTFQIEKSLMLIAKESLSAREGQFVLCYTPHPIHDLRKPEEIQFFKDNNIIVYKDTIFSLLIADACLGLYSGALFDAVYAGVRAFTPIRSADLIYPDTLLKLLSTPSDRTTIQQSLSQFIYSVTPENRASFIQRYNSRVSKLFPIRKLAPG